MLKAFINNIEDNIKYSHVKTKVPYIDFHLHDGCEIYFLISGDVNYFVEKNIYPLKFGDLIITNNNEIHKPAFTSDVVYERITLEFNQDLPQLFSTNNFDVLNCFYNRISGEQNKISLSPNETSNILELFHKYENLCNITNNAANLLRLNCFIELMVYINNLFLNVRNIDENNYIPLKLQPILDYIDKNLDSDLSLEVIEKKFFISRFYLSKLFKKFTGSTIHEYIIYKRISIAKKLLTEGCNVTEACMKSGFNDYSNFLKVFKKTVGILPGKYNKIHGR